MKKHIFYFLALVSIITLSSCAEETPEPTGIDFITMDEDSKSYLLNEGATLNTQFTIYTANKVSTDLTVNLDITTTLAADNYTVPASVTIPANSNEVTFDVSVTENGLDKVNGETMSIALNSPDNYFNGTDVLDLKFDVFCESSIDGSYIYSDGNGKPATIVADSGVNKFVLSGDNRYNSNYYIELNDQCGSLSIVGGQLDVWGYSMSGSGEVLPNGNIVLTITAEGLYENRTMTLVKQ
jgi:hypothetical protein